MTRGIYLDNSMTSQPSEKAVSRMLPFLTDMWGTPSAPHQLGQEVFPAIEEALQSIYALLGADETDDFVFTSCGAEAINHVIMSAYYEVTRPYGKNQFITSHLDEAPAIMAIGRLQQLGCVGKMVSPNQNGIVTAQAIADAITPRTALVSLSWANGLTGVIHPVAEIAALCQSRGILLHLDATHILGKHFYELSDIGAHFITFNGDHLHAPKGTGGLYVKAGTKYASFILGGLEQAGKRAGSLNVPALVALGCAAKEALENRDLMCTEVARLRNKLEQGILDVFPDAIPFYCNQERLPHCAIMAFPGVANEALLYSLNRKNVFASMGGGSFQQISLLLSAAGVSEQIARTALSFSLSRSSNDDEIERAALLIGQTARTLRKVSIQLD